MCQQSQQRGTGEPPKESETTFEVQNNLKRCAYNRVSCARCRRHMCFFLSFDASVISRCNKRLRHQARHSAQHVQKEGELPQDPIRGLRRRRTPPPSITFSA